MNKELILEDLGLRDYKETWDYQEALFAKTVALKVQNKKENNFLPTPNHFLFVEHPHVFTLGKSGNLEHLLVSEEALK